MDKITQLQELINHSHRAVFFGGAGMSTESGIPDFRSEDGLYRQKYAYPPETILSADFYYHHTEEFYRFYREKMLCLDAKPNIGHDKLAEMEQKGKLQVVITQNIDGLHQAAGSQNVLELHGSVHRNYCTRCNKFYDAQFILQSTKIPHCSCGGTIKPDVVLYGEALNSKILHDAASFIANSDLLIIGGTSLAVYPAAGLIDYYNGDYLVLINRSKTAADFRADLSISSAIGELFQKLHIN